MKWLPQLKTSDKLRTLMKDKGLWIAIVVMVLLLGGGVFFLTRPKPKGAVVATPTPLVSPIPESAILPAVEELKIEDLVVGNGAEAVNGAAVTVHYTGTLTDGSKFDSSLDRGQPFTFNLGAGEVIAGWDQGVLGMKVGGKRKLTIPSDLGYGERGVPPAIPPNATLIFEVELLKVEK